MVAWSSSPWDTGLDGSSTAVLPPTEEQASGTAIEMEMSRLGKVPARDFGLVGSCRLCEASGRALPLALVGSGGEMISMFKSSSVSTSPARAW